ncbi:hypothetical protein IF1G_04009 [Cordyceps javanica]|uniref:Uncharacterized protein n=1 Tax=Cordyceps javanica TaxID=43265 RepID=A0A545V4X9_9HYPO|nr:hypothetical protein IF1G_04009 [Cordyceps javanica]
MYGLQDSESDLNNAGPTCNRACGFTGLIEHPLPYLDMPSYVSGVGQCAPLTPPTLRQRDRGSAAKINPHLSS